MRPEIGFPAGVDASMTLKYRFQFGVGHRFLPGLNLEPNSCQPLLVSSLMRTPDGRICDIDVSRALHSRRRKVRSRLCLRSRLQEIVAEIESMIHIEFGDLQEKSGAGSLRVKIKTVDQISRQISLVP